MNVHIDGSGRVTPVLSDKDIARLHPEARMSAARVALAPDEYDSDAPIGVLRRNIEGRIRHINDACVKKSCMAYAKCRCISFGRGRIVL